MRSRRAFVMAAGTGSRLGELTKDTPKCLLPVRGEPLLARGLRLLAEVGVREALVNTHHLAPQVEAFLAGADLGLRARTVHEPELLGSAGTVRANLDFAAGGDVWVLYADTLIEAPLAPLAKLHGERESALTLGLFESPAPEAGGVAEIDADGRLLSFEEKPAEPKSRLAAAGVYLLVREALEAARRLRPGSGPLDIGRDLVPRLVGRAWALPLAGTVIDIGTPEGYARAQSSGGAP